MKLLNLIQDAVGKGVGVFPAHSGEELFELLFAEDLVLGVSGLGDAVGEEHEPILLFELVAGFGQDAVLDAKEHGGGVESIDAAVGALVDEGVGVAGVDVDEDAAGQVHDAVDDAAGDGVVDLIAEADEHVIDDGDQPAGSSAVLMVVAKQAHDGGHYEGGPHAVADDVADGKSDLVGA